MLHAHKTGGFTQAATAIAVDVEVGFLPEKVTVENETDRIRMEWDNTMAAGEASITDAAGTRTLIAANGITLIQGTQEKVQGFTIGLDTAGTFNIASKVMKWTALRS